MKINIFQWRYIPFLMLLPLWLPVGNAQAALSVTCQAGMNTAPGGNGTVNLGTITPANAKSASITGTLSYTCTNTGDTAGYVSVCLAVDGGSYGNNTIGPRYMTIGGGYVFDPRLEFTMKLPSGGRIWGSRGKTGSEYNSGSLSIPANSGISRSVTIDIAMTSASVGASEGTYTNYFYDGHTALTFRTSENSSGLNCGTGPQGPVRFPFLVQAAVKPVCTITADTPDVNLGSKPASEKNILGNSDIRVTCTNGGSYYIGLKPSNNNPNGAGVMSGTPGNSDEVPYQLRSTSGIGGTIWGNTATSTTVGNGVAGFGSGFGSVNEQIYPVYITVPSADFKPDKYSDTVIINVNY